MQHVPCNLCGRGEAARHLWTLPDRHWVPGARFELVRCASCGLVYLNPQPSLQELEPHYPPSTFQELTVGSSRAFAWRLAGIERHHPKGRILDIGCGNGAFLAFLHEQGWDVAGFDTSAEGVRIGQRLLGDRIQRTTLREAAYPPGQFDAACLFEVLEHVPDPRGELAEVARILKPGGVVCLSVPNFSSWERALFGPWWNGLDAPRHLYQYTPQTLRRLLEASGLTVVELRSANACDIQTSKPRIDYCQESLRFFLRDLGWYPKKAEAPSAGQAGLPSAQPPTLAKRLVRAAEGAVFGAFCRLARLADRDNSLWACARKP